MPHRNRRQDVADEVVGAVLHAPGGARGADRGLAGEGDEPLETTGGAANSPETSGQDSAIHVSAQLAFDEGGQAAAVGAAFTSSGSALPATSVAGTRYGYAGAEPHGDGAPAPHAKVRGG